MPSAEAEKPIPAAPEIVWRLAGAFDALGAWHPAASACRTEEGGRTRRARLVDGAQLVDVLLQHDEAARAYSYRLAEGPWPVSSFQALFHVEEDGAGGAVARWSARFDLSDDSDPQETARQIQGFFESGLEHLAQLASLE
ncbi:MAG: SRPBCC family protein [Marivibrio sp.]|uniref:SRPBCC family protein n=1 Tax=Marivibrio sp. TaxID=2039719 RepID=UPI0032EF59AA